MHGSEGAGRGQLRPATRQELRDRVDVSRLVRQIRNMD